MPIWSREVHGTEVNMLRAHPAAVRVDLQLFFLQAPFQHGVLFLAGRPILVFVAWVSMSLLMHQLDEVVRDATL